MSIIKGNDAWDIQQLERAEKERQSMTTDSTDSSRKEEPLHYWCDDCRQCGMVHCCEVADCSSMKRLTRAEIDALREKHSPQLQIGEAP